MKKRLCAVAFAAMVLVAAAGVGHSAETPEIGKYAYVYKGGEGVQVTLLRIGPVEKTEVLLQVNRVDHPWDRRIILHKIRGKGRRLDYTTQFDGQEWITMTLRDGNRELYLPGIELSGYLSYSEELSNKVEPQNFLKAYMYQEEVSKKK